MRRPLLPVALIVAMALSLFPALGLAQSGDGPTVALRVDGSPLVVGEGRNVHMSVSLSQPAQLRLKVVDFDGRTVKQLFDRERRAGVLEREWFGRDETGERVPPGPYRIVAAASADGVTDRAETWITVSDRALYPKAPGFVTVAVDPGHGGDYDGAVAADGTREADLNLDIGLRLARMLEGAGANVVLTRSTDGHANEPPLDRNGDRETDGDDELAARPDAANLARADLFISIHNNSAVNASVGGPSTLFFDERPYGGRNARLARIVQEEMVKGLADAVDGEWEPYDHGAIVYPYFVLRGYDPPRLRRPTQMPAVLSEGLFLSNERELSLLQRRAVRGAMAAAYYRAVVKYLARRGAHLGYELVEGPTEALTSGDQATYRIEVRNQGTERVRDWRLEAEAVKAPKYYAGRVGRGEVVGRARIPRLAPGESKVVEISVAAPAEAREWMLVFDARDRDRGRASSLGVPPLQVRLTTVDPVGLPVPSVPADDA